MNSNPNLPVLHQVSALIDAILNLEKGRTFQIRGQRIYPSEVHLLLNLADRPEANATDLASRQGLTKGAISQTLSRLETKGLLVKNRIAANKNALDLELTPEGRETVEYFQQKTARMRVEVERHLDTLEADERRAIEAFLASLGNALTSMGGGE